MTDIRFETEHRWFEYGRWFYGYGSSMDGHSCTRHAEQGGQCQVRRRVVTVGDWTDWETP